MIFDNCGPLFEPFHSLYSSRHVRDLFDRAGINEFSHFFYQEIDSWEVWKIEQQAQKRKQIKRLCTDWLQKYICLT